MHGKEWRAIPSRPGSTVGPEHASYGAEAEYMALSFTSRQFIQIRRGPDQLRQTESTPSLASKTQKWITYLVIAKDHYN